MSNNSTISREELQNKLAEQQPIVLLEALPERYYQEGHLPGAAHMPHDRVRELAPSLAPEKSSEIVVYCASDTCQNSHQAAAQLRHLGYANVRVYAGGKADWEQAGLSFQS